MSKQDRDVPGNALGSQIQYERTLVRLAEQLIRFERIAEREFDSEFYYKKISIRVPTGEGDEYFGVVTRGGPNGGEVGFHTSDTLADCLRGLIARLENNSIKWKDDEYAN